MDRTMTTVVSREAASTNTRAQWAFLLLRVFLGTTFLYAGIQKLIDPQFFRPSAPGYIGNQMAVFAAHSPLHSFLANVAVPHATLFGLLVIYGEILIGLGTLFGFLLRPAAFAGAVLSFILFLSATWRVYPYFYGADIVFTFCWLALLLNGPGGTVLPTLDELLLSDLANEPTRQGLFLRLFLGVGKPLVGERTLRSATSSVDERRRVLLYRAVGGGAGVLGLVGLGYLLRVIPSSFNSTNATATVAQGKGKTLTATTTTTTPTAADAIAQVSSVSTNSAVAFGIPSSGNPGVLVHLDNGQFVAYDALCTHAGCEVSYDSGSQLLLCPCHGAAFDPAKNGAVVQPPATTPLTPVSIHVDSATGSIFLKE
jgi:thiosulfate dehydrogenase [quinone] large subunit